MTFLDVVMLLLVAGLSGMLAQALVGYSHGGCLASIVLGLIGALLGTWLSRLVGMGELLSISIGGQSFPLVWSVIGAALFVAVLGFLNRRSW